MNQPFVLLWGKRSRCCKLSQVFPQSSAIIYSSK